MIHFEIWTLCIMLKVFTFDVLFSFVLCSKQLFSHSRVFIFQDYVSHEYPHCFGTLVSYKHVLTAASCVLGTKMNNVNPVIKNFIVSKVNWFICWFWKRENMRLNYSDSKKHESSSLLSDCFWYISPEPLELQKIYLHLFASLSKELSDEKTIF